MNEILNIVDTFLQQGHYEQAFNLLQQVVDKGSADYIQRYQVCAQQLHNLYTAQIQQSIGRGDATGAKELIAKYRSMLGNNEIVDQLERMMQPQPVQSGPAFQPAAQTTGQAFGGQTFPGAGFQPNAFGGQAAFGQQPFGMGFPMQQPSKPMWQTICGWNLKVLGFVAIGVWFLALIVATFTNNITVGLIFNFLRDASIVLMAMVIFAEAGTKMNEGTGIGISLLAGGGIMLIFDLVLMFVSKDSLFKTRNDLLFMLIIGAAGLAFALLYAFFRVNDFSHRVPTLLLGSAFAAETLALLIALSKTNEFARLLNELSSNAVFAVLMFMLFELIYDNSLKPKKA